MTHDIAAEQAVLGSCMLSPVALGEALELVSNEDWFRPAHETIWAAIRELHEQRIIVDPITVAGKLTKMGELARVGGAVYLHTLIESVATTTNIDYHARLVASTAVRRRTVAALTTLLQRAQAPETDLHQLHMDAQLELELVAQTMIGEGPITGVHTWEHFIAEFAQQAQNWVVPGLIGRKDVWMILAPPGAGKTTLSRQMCWMIAGGLHPFRPTQRIEPKRTLLIDLENDEGMAADESLDWYGRIDSLGNGIGERGWIWARPQGLNVRQAADAQLLDQVIGDTKPDFIALGSLYKAFVRSGDWDQSAGEARVVFDRLRARHQVTFWLEHHMPKATDGGRKHTPFGSSIWEWWSSHGRVLEKTKEVPGAPYMFSAKFRGDRRKVECPVGFVRGGRLPWEAIWDQGELDVLTEQAK